MKLSLLFVTFILFCVEIKPEYNEEEGLAAKLQLIDMDLEETCEDMARTFRNALIANPVNFSEKILVEEDYGRYLRFQNQFLNHSESGFSFDRNLTVLAESGDVLMAETDWKKLVTYYNTYEEMYHNSKATGKDDSLDSAIGKQDFLNVLAASKNFTKLQRVWSSWQDLLLEGEQYYPILQLISKAAKANHNYDAKSYWEKLNDYEEGYKKAEVMWTEIQPLYLKLHGFVLHKINTYYKSNFTEIPAYLSGSNFADDWSNIADILLPHPQLHYDAKSRLKRKNLKEAFVLAEEALNEAGLGLLGKQFWQQSKFDLDSCEHNLITYCGRKYTELLTCNKLDWTSYLDAHETAIKVALNNHDYEAILRLKLRYSAFDEAVVSLGTIFAIDNLPRNGLLPEDTFKLNENGESNNQLTALLLLALRIFPKLAYYIGADTWRLDELEIPGNFTASWWDVRQRYQGIAGINNDEPDFLGDSHIVSNKPYLSKFLGIMLQFQLLNYHQVTLFTEGNDVLQNFKNDITFLTAVQDRPNKSLLDLVNYHYGIDDINTLSFMQYFQPLEEYLNTYPSKQDKVIKRKIIDPPKRKVKFTEPAVKATTTLELIANVTTIPEVTTEKIEKKLESTKEPSTKKSYITISVLLCLLAVGAIAFFVWKLIGRKKHTNNRRFET